MGQAMPPEAHTTVSTDPSTASTQTAQPSVPASSDPLPAPLIVFGLHSTTPPATDPSTTMLRTDEINNVQRILNEPHTSVVTLIGAPGVGKSTLATIWYRRLLVARQQGLPAPRYMVWLTLNSYTTLPDIITAILKGVEMEDAGLFLRKPEQQISTLLRALRRPHENALVVLDQFEELLQPEVKQAPTAPGALSTFLDMLQTDLGASRVVLTSYQSLIDEQKQHESRIRSYLVSRISPPEGAALLEQRGVEASPEDYSLAWQRCTGHVFSLVLVSALVQQSGISLQTLLSSPTYQPLWEGDVSMHLIARIQRYLNPLQEMILQLLSLFNEPAPPDGLKQLITSRNASNEQKYSPTLCEREMQRLIQLGLIQPILSAAGEPAYTLHTLLRQYLLEHVAENGLQRTQFGAGSNTPALLTAQQSGELQLALAAGHTQIASYYEQVIPQLCPPREQRQKALDVELIINTIRHLALGRRWQRANDLLFDENLHESLVEWGRWNTLLGLYTALLPPFGVLLHYDEGRISSHVAMLYGRLGELQQSRTYFEHALAIQRQVGDQQGEAMTLTNQGELQRIQGESEQARTSFERALSLLGTAPVPQLRCILLNNLGLLFQQDGVFQPATQCYSEALQLATQIGNQQFTGTILTNMGMLLYEQQEQQEGLALLLAALRVREMMHDPSVPLLERFLVALEQKMGVEAYTQACKAALAIQPQVFARFTPQNMRQ